MKKIILKKINIKKGMLYYMEYKQKNSSLKIHLGNVES